jgi:hypothetical protein
VSRTAILCSVVVLWAGGLAAMARRQAAARTDPRRLAAAGALVTPRDVYYRVEQNGHQVGFAASRLDTADGGFTLSDYLMADRKVPRAGASASVVAFNRTTLSSRVWLTHAFALQRFVVTSDTGAGPTQIEVDPVGDTALRIVTTPPAKEGPPTTRVVAGTPLTLAPSLLPLALALGGTPLKVGTHTQLPELDPVDGPRPVTLSIAAESLFVLPDSAVKDPATRLWVPYSTDTLRAWRVTPSAPVIGGTPLVAWIDDEGRTVAAAFAIPAAGPVTLHRTVYELAHENWIGKFIFFRKVDAP